MDYQIQYNVGKVKYLVSFFQGNYHKDGSKFYDIKCFSNKKTMNMFIKSLTNPLLSV